MFKSISLMFCWIGVRPWVHQNWFHVPCITIGLVTIVLVNDRRCKEWNLIFSLPMYQFGSSISVTFAHLPHSVVAHSTCCIAVCHLLLLCWDLLPCSGFDKHVHHVASLHKCSSVMIALCWMCRLPFLCSLCTSLWLKQVLDLHTV